jgi:hydroxymethylpyrimidine kinase/phosphomethylpyrimidine kinase/thiamine-phosphate diphosphorylase
MNSKIVWTIAGSDPTGAAGIAADLRTCQHLGVHGCPVITAVTAQNNHSVSHVDYLSAEALGAQIESLKQDFKPVAIKVGMLGQVELVKMLNDFFTTYSGSSVVLDPLLYASSGKPLFEGSESAYVTALKKLLPLVDVVTPNVPEAEKIAGCSIASYQEIEMAAQKIVECGAKSVLIKGGHFNESAFAQDYWTNGVDAFWLASKRAPDLNYRGTGCVLSSAIASGIALGHDIKDALVIAKMVVNRGIRLAEKVDDRSALLCLDLESHHSQMDLPMLSSQRAFKDPAQRTLGLGSKLTMKKRDPSFRWDDQESKNFPNCGSQPLGLYPVVDSLEWLKQLLPLGVTTIQLRIKHKKGAELESIIQEAISFAKTYQARLFINDHWQLAIKYGAYGVHLGQEDLDTADLAAIRQASLRLGISTHCYYEVARAYTVAPSYMAIGPVFHTTSKVMPFMPQGISSLQRWRAMLNTPLVAIGGINLENIQEVIETGVDGIAMISAITKAENPKETTKQLLEKFNPCSTSL